MELIVFMLSLYKTNIMADQIILQITLKDGDAIEIKTGGDQINPLMLVGILEQVQLNILDGLSTTTEEPKLSNQTYDA